MIRVVFENVLLFLLPTAVYLTYMLLVRKRAGSGAIDLLNDAPVFALIAAGLGAIVATFLMFGSMKDGSPGQTYEPSVFKDGQLVPGRVK